MSAARVERAPAKVNLTLRVIGRRADGNHEIESLVVFAGVGDVLTLTPGRGLALAVRGPMAAGCGEIADNLVFKAARSLAERIDGLELGRFVLSKRLPVAAGLGGGSSDAAAALRLLARANGLELEHPVVIEAARATGADVPVCLDPRPRLMRGIGEILSDPLQLPRLPAVLVNPGVMLPTKDVFAALDSASSAAKAAACPPTALSAETGDASDAWCSTRPSRTTLVSNLFPAGEEERAAFVSALANDRNALEPPAIQLQPVIAHVLAALRRLPNCRLARMSGSGATCFGLFDSQRVASAAARALRAEHPAWWVRATTLAGGRGADV